MYDGVAGCNIKCVHLYIRAGGLCNLALQLTDDSYEEMKRLKKGNSFLCNILLIKNCSFLISFNTTLMFNQPIKCFICIIMPI
jgi:hypothetical protein